MLPCFRSREALLSLQVYYFKEYQNAEGWGSSNFYFFGWCKIKAKPGGLFKIKGITEGLLFAQRWDFLDCFNIFDRPPYSTNPAFAFLLLSHADSYFIWLVEAINENLSVAVTP